MTSFGVSELSIICSCNGLPPLRCQAIACTSADLLTIMTLGNRLHWNLDKRTKVPLMETHLNSWVAKIALFLSDPGVLLFVQYAYYIMYVFFNCSKWNFLCFCVCLCSAHIFMVDVLVTFKIRWAFVCNAQFVLSLCLCYFNRLLILWWMYHEHDTTYCCRWIF